MKKTLTRAVLAIGAVGVTGLALYAMTGPRKESRDWMRGKDPESLAAIEMFAQQWASTYPDKTVPDLASTLADQFSPEVDWSQPPLEGSEEEMLWRAYEEIARQAYGVG